MKDVEASAARIGAQEEEVARCKEVLRVDSEAVKASEEAVEVTTKEVAEFDANLQATIDEKEHYNSVYNDCFIPAKSNPADKKDISQLSAAVKKLGTESSLQSALAPALKKSPADRGTFDFMAIDGIEGLFTKHLETLQEQIE